jgi:deazaflavin-dependent oxidoreductase (nitroreductase family)
VYLADESVPDRVYVFASAGGSDKNPDWFHNVVAHPRQITVEIGSDVIAAHADVVPEPERSDIYALQASRYPGFAAYEKRTSRRIPVVALTLQSAVGAL